MYPFLKRFPDAKRWYTITPSYVFGDSLLRNVGEVAKEHNLDLIGNAYHPLGATEYSSIITAAIAAKPDSSRCSTSVAMRSRRSRRHKNSAQKHAKLLYVWSGGLLDYQDRRGRNGRSLRRMPILARRVARNAQSQRTISESIRRADGLRRRERLHRSQARADRNGARKVERSARGRESTTRLQLHGADRTRNDPRLDHQVIKPYYFLRGKSEKAMQNQWDFVETLGRASYPVPQSESQCKLG